MLGLCFDRDVTETPFPLKPHPAPRRRGSYIYFSAQNEDCACVRWPQQLYITSRNGRLDKNANAYIQLLSIHDKN
jgi:hypothetical protein